MSPEEKSQFEAMKQEVALFQKYELERNQGLRNHLATMEVLSKALDFRVKALEEARQRQIALNATFAVKGLESNRAEAKPKKFWDLFR